jgi:hypothetical protein
MGCPTQVVEAVWHGDPEGKLSLYVKKTASWIDRVSAIDI